MINNGKFALITKKRIPDIILIADTLDDLNRSIDKLYWNKKGLQPQGNKWTLADMFNQYGYKIVKIHIKNLPNQLL